MQCFFQSGLPFLYKTMCWPMSKSVSFAGFSGYLKLFFHAQLCLVEFCYPIVLAIDARVGHPVILNVIS